MRLNRGLRSAYDCAWIVRMKRPINKHNDQALNKMSERLLGCCR